MVDQREALLTATRQAELVLDPVRGAFDVAHLREVHRRIFRDLPHHGPGEFRPDAAEHFKHRRLETTNARIVVPYALRPKTDRMLGPTLEALRGGRALRDFDLLEMSEAIAQTYARLDYLHPFQEGNSRTLRTFTEQLARDNGYQLDWGTTNVTPQSRDALYIARDMAAVQLRYPGLSPAKMMSVGDRQTYEMAFQLDTYRRHDPLQEIVRCSLERGRDPLPHDRRMNVADVVREIAAIGPVALTQAEREVEASHFAVLRGTAAAADHNRTIDLRDWIARHGNMVAVAARLEEVDSGHITIRHEPGASALVRVGAITDGIGRELAQQQAMRAPVRSIGYDDVER